MRDAIGKFISQTKMNRDTIRQLAAMLPTDDAELDALLSQLVAEKHSSHFVCVVVASLHNERILDARHLELGGYMLSAGPLLQKFGWSAKGDVPRYLLNAIKGGNMITHQLVIAALLLIVLWCKEHQQPLPDDFLEAARRNIRSADARKTFPQMLSTLAYEMNDEVSIKIMEEECEVSQKERDDCLEEFLQHCRGPAINLITDTSGQTVATGITMRRAVEKIGRNDPCPCGSGKKYKQCCIAKDQERLRRSSPIAGLTHDELRIAPEKGLTKDLLNRIFAVNLMQYDPTRIPKEIFPDYLDRLTVCKCFDRGAEAFEKVGFSKELDAAWHNMAFFAAQVQRKDIIDRLFAVRPDAAEIEDEVHMSIGLLRGEGKPERILEILEHCANNSVKVNEADNYKGYAWGMLVSKYPGMAIIVARSVIPLIPTKEATFIYEYLLQVRDKMKLTGEEPFGDILDERIRKENSNERSLQDASQKLEDKAREVRRLNEAVHQLQRDLELRERRAEQAAKAPAAAAIEQRATDTLREKMDTLKEELKRQHNERNELRRELQQAQQNLEELQAQPKSNVVNLPVRDGEDDMVLPEENNSVQPVRLIEFPNKFQETLNGLPKHVARAAMSMIGRLAAGEPAAFVGVVRLKLCPNILRQRIGIDHRLLFRLQPGYVEVIDLINRRDLERRVKALI